MLPRLVVLGSSTGGMDALRVLMRALPARFPAAVVIVQHRVADGSGDLAALLARESAMPVDYPLDKELILPGRVYVAPPNYHLLIEKDHFAYSLDAPENYARPSIDVLFESAAEAAGKRAIGIVLTGMGRDGAQGLATIHRFGGQAMVQTDAAAPQMPMAAMAAVPKAHLLPLDKLVARLAGLK